MRRRPNRGIRAGSSPSARGEQWAIANMNQHHQTALFFPGWDYYAKTRKHEDEAVDTFARHLSPPPAARPHAIKTRRVGAPFTYAQA